MKKTTSLFEFTPKGKEPGVSTKKESKREDLLSNIMGKFMNLGNGIKGKTL